MNAFVRHHICMHKSFTTLSLKLFLGSSLFLVPIAVSAASTAAIRIDQVSPVMPGVWTFLKPNGETLKSTGTGVNIRSHSFSITEFGPMTLSVVPPVGTVVQIKVYRSGELIQTVKIPQVSIELFPNQDYRFVIEYTYSRLGSIGITSDPPRLRFRLKNTQGGRTYTGTSPKTMINIPAGTYALTFNKTRDCILPAPHTVAVKPGERNTVNVTLMCDNAESTTEVLRDRPTKRSIVNSVSEREAERAATHE